MNPHALIHTGSHEVVIGEELSLFQHIADRCEGARCFVLVDEHTEEHCLPLLEEALGEKIEFELLRIPSGEEYKTLGTCHQGWKELLARQADRKSLLVNLGGGVINDLGGFVGATFKRGIHFVHVPTTLLAMVDASIGGKNGVDLEGVKNQVGVFQWPEAVLVHPPFLKTLPKRQILSGFAEMIKHGLLEGADAWAEIRNIDPLDHERLSEPIARSIKFKNSIVEADEREGGRRKILNLGHTVGHAVESWSLVHDEDPLLHGEAVAIGLYCEAWLSCKRSGFPRDRFEELSALLGRSFPPRPTGDPEAVIRYMEMDKKNAGGRILGVLLNNIGEPVFDQSFVPDEVEQALEAYQTEFAR